MQLNIKTQLLYFHTCCRTCRTTQTQFDVLHDPPPISLGIKSISNKRVRDHFSRDRVTIAVTHYALHTRCIIRRT